MPDDLYDRDILAWSMRQADRLRRLRAGERVNDLDWDNVIEEIESVGKSQVDAVRGLLLQAFIHALKAHAWPDHAARRKWHNEAATFLADAGARFEPGMAQAIDLSRLFDRARRAVLGLDMLRPPAPLPVTTDLGVAEAMADHFTVDDLIARLRPPQA